MIDKIKDSLSGPIEMNVFTVALFILAILFFVGISILLFRSFSACCRYTKKKRYPFFHIGHILCYGIIVGYYFLQKDYLDTSVTEKIPKVIIISIGVVLFIIPTLSNLVKCGIVYGLQYSLWQMVFSLIFCSFVYAIIGIIILTIASVVGAVGSSDDGRKIWLVNYHTASFPVRVVSSTYAIDNDGNHYYRNGEYYYDDSGNYYWQT